MSAVLNIDERVIGGGRLRDQAAGQAQTATSGYGVLPTRRWKLTHGTGDGQGNQWYLARRICTAGGTDHLDLRSGLANLTGTINLTHVKRVLVVIVDPDGTKKLRIGPQNVANAAQLWFGGTGATVYAEVFDEFDMKNRYTGWALTAGTADILGISNPGGADVEYAIWVVGRQ